MVNPTRQIVPVRPGRTATLEAPKPRVRIGPFEVDDLTSQEVVDRAVDLALAPGDRPTLMYALHVGGLNAASQTEFVEELNRGDLVYADGGSVVLLGRLAGARSIERSPTTDIGWDVLHEFAAREGRPARLALVGGSDGLSTRAGEVLARGGAGEVVFTTDGYVDDWAGVVDRLGESRPDVCIVGLGAPLEMLWCRAWAHALPPALVMTCGGWFGFLAGQEKRAPRALRVPGLEWVSRVVQSPRRLGGRYARGVLTTSVMAVRTSITRLLP